MSDTENTSESLDFSEDIQCSINISLLTSDDIEFDFFYKDKEALKCLCKIIMMIQKSDFLLSSLISDDIEESDKNTILEFFSSAIEDVLDDGTPVIYPIDVYKQGGEL